MKTISSGLAAHLAGEVTTLATCWKLTRTDGSIMGFTDHDQDIVVDAVSYVAASGFTPTAIENQARLAVDNLDVEGMLDSGNITEADIMAGKYDFAEVEIFMVNYTDLTQGTLPLRRGWLGEVTLRNGQFSAEVRGLSQRLSQTVGELYSPSCRAQFGDNRCTVNLTSHTVTGTVSAVTSNQVFEDDTRAEVAGSFTFGRITFTSGANDGLSMEVKEHMGGGKLILVMPMPYDVQTGDSYSLIKGCDKTFQTCAQVYENAVNFRGEPHVPGLDKMLETAGTRSNR